MRKLFLLLFTFSIACQSKTKLGKEDSKLNASVNNQTSNAIGSDTPLILHEEIMRYIPDSMEILDTSSGNLNLDAKDDLIVILKTKNEQDREDVYDNPNRPLLIFIKLVDGRYQFKGQNNKLVKCIRCGGSMGDPFVDVVIKNGYFSVEHYGGSRERWMQTTTFKYNKAEQNWLLHRDAEEVIDVMSEDSDEPKTISSTMKTAKDFGIIKFQDYSNELTAE